MELFKIACFKDFSLSYSVSLLIKLSLLFLFESIILLLLLFILFLLFSSVKILFCNNDVLFISLRGFISFEFKISF